MQQYKHKRVLITGHTGFKGAWLAQILLQNEAIVCGVSLAPSYDDSLFDQLNLADKMESHFVNINDMSCLRSVFDSFKPEFVFHLAAQALVRPSYKDPITTYETNVLGSLKVLECCRASSSVKSVVMVTTDKCYENKEWLWPYRETDELGGHDLYSSSKACNEIVVSSFVRSFGAELTTKGMRISTARAGNVIGGGDWAEDRLIPDIFRAIKAKEKLVIRNPHATRPWQHVLEPLFGYLNLALKQLDDKTYAGAWNFGPSAASVMTVEAVLELINHYCSVRFEWAVDSTEQPHEAHNLILDCTKAYTKLKWKTQFSPQDTAIKTIEIYEQQLLKQPIDAAVSKQIEAYQNGL